MLAPAAAKAVRKLPRNERERILAAIERLPAGDVRSLKARPGEWRLRVGDWRALIRLDSEASVIVVTAVEPRGGALPNAGIQDYGTAAESEPFTGRGKRRPHRVTVYACIYIAPAIVTLCLGKWYAVERTEDANESHR